MATCPYNQNDQQMKRFKFTLTLLLISIGSLTALSGKSATGIVINEFLVDNQNNFVDSYGERSGWIEIFNASYGTIDLGGYFLSNDPTNLRLYMIPKSDILTAIKPRQHLLFYTDGRSAKGTFHVNFKLEDSQEIFLTSNDGRTIIDRVTIPHDQLKADYSYGRVSDGGARWAVMVNPTPSTNNSGAYDEPKGLSVATMDPRGFAISITAMSVVFSALLLLTITFKLLSTYNVYKTRLRTARATGRSRGECGEVCEEVPGEVYAAIAAALHAYEKDQEIHDIENTILTISKVTKNYSPWSSKIYALRDVPNRK